MIGTEKTKRRRIMIISGDESIIDEIKNSKNASLCKSLILEAEDDSMDLTSLQDNSSPARVKKNKNVSLICVICGAPALGYNFDAISCESCKSFFRRNALRDPPLECPRDGSCNITFESRRQCSACRLVKCLQNGMRRDRLLVAEQKAVKRRRRDDDPNLNLDTALLFSTEFMPPSDANLVFLNYRQPSPPQTRTGLLTSEDLQRIESIQLLYQNRIELARDGLPWNPSEYSITFLQKLNSHSVPLIRLLTFFKQIPEFSELNVEDKVTLIKFNLLPLLCINCTLSYKIETDQIVETDSDVPWDPSIIQEVYGYEGYLQMRKVFESFVYIAQYDHRIIQLALITLILTKGFSAGEGELEPILNDGMAVYRAQNYYSELLWKYIETMHGRHRAISIWSKIVTHFITWQTLHKRLRDNVQKNLSKTDTSELLPLMKTLFHI
ncbi:unnamed protein product [Adineta ricciae]|uniref:Uncharacterized protein n=1 Tax=Adineta ricciae TaxID=249248 RepID=A0A815ZPC3_ADIRI|nr:unnamed protein product [Adineta ricciae]